jgi:ABC-type transporter Mla subunit MlaD
MRRTRTRFDISRWFGLLGVLTVSTVAGIAYIAYRANTGLPLQSRYQVTVLVPDADRLIDAADVRIGGVLVGTVLNVSAVPGAHAAPPYARVNLALDGSIGRLPVDTTVQVRPASVLGLTYVDLHLGTSRQTIPAGGTLLLSRAKPSSDLTDLFQVFNRGAARGFTGSVTGLASGVAGRGTALNAALASSASLLPALTDVTHVLGAPATHLSAFLSGYESTVGALAPVSAQLAGLVQNAATTLGAVARVRGALGAAIDRAPAAESATTVAFQRALPALDGLARLAIALRPAGALLPTTLTQVNSTLTAGLPALRDLPGFSRPLGTAMQTLDALARDPNTTNSLRKLLDLIPPTNTVLSTFTPAQVHCNVLGLWTLNFSSAFDALGSGQGPVLPDAFLQGTGAIGEILQNAKPSPNVAIDPLPYENASQCQSGNEPWTGHQQLNNPPGLTSRTTRTTTPPPGVTALARAAGLLKPIPGAPQ